MAGRFQVSKPLPDDNPVVASPPVPTRQLFPAWEKAVRVVWIAAAVAVPVGGFLVWQSRQPKIVRFPTARPVTAERGYSISPAISADGKRLAYAAKDDQGRMSLFVQNLPDGEPRRLDLGDRSATSPEFSPDGRWFAFRSESEGGGVDIVPLEGGTPRRLGPGGYSPRYSPDGRWIAYFRTDGPSSRFAFGSLYVVAAQGGDPRRIRPEFQFARYPIWAGDSTHLLFEGQSPVHPYDWYVTSVDGGEVVRTGAYEVLKDQIRNKGRPDCWKDNRVLFAGTEEESQHVWALGIRPGDWKATGPARRLTNGVDPESAATVGAGDEFAFARTRRTVDLYSLKRDSGAIAVQGKLERLTDDRAEVTLPELSADGRWLAFQSNRTGLNELYVWDLSTPHPQRLTAFRSMRYRPVLSRDGTHLALPTEEDGECRVGVVSLANRDDWTYYPGCFSLWDWSPDGRRFLIFDGDAARRGVEVLEAGSLRRVPFLSDPDASIYAARLSPDGRMVSFTVGVTSADARNYIAPVGAAEIPRESWIEIPEAAGGTPAWSPDGKVLYVKSLRDGYDCLYGQGLDDRHRPTGPLVQVLHLHEPGFGIDRLHLSSFNVTVSRDRIVLSIERDIASVWLSRIRKDE